MNPGTRLPALLLLTAASACAVAADGPASAPAPACRDCGVIQDIRRLALPIAPRVDPLARQPGQGGQSRYEQQGTTPMFSIGSGGIQRVEPYESKALQKIVWEVTVRYDNGAFGVTRVEQEPELKVGERVRLIESGSENLLQKLPPPKP
ncbi:MAG: hypothetical protein ACREUW_16405 [Burkholderiales bacterium]